MPLPDHRFKLLDGLRGVAALMVIFYHIGECFATSPQTQDINHGYLAVDFFFVLSGFVIGYANDNRWAKGLTSGRFLLRRIIRLQPMVIAGVLLGVCTFLIQGCEKWDGSAVSLAALALSLLLGLFMIPSLPGTLPEVRGNGEMFPLNGPSWSLFFEYIGSIFYALFLHRLSTRALTIFTASTGLLLATISIGNFSGFYHLGVGWTAADGGFWMGLVRMAYSFSVGLLLVRSFRSANIRGAFWICSAMIVGILCVPYLGAEKMPVLNGIFDALCTLFLFPCIVFLGASDTASDRHTSRICEFLGRLSYPLYIVHYPFMYLMYSWAWSNHLGFASVWPVALAIVFGSILLAWLLMRFYDLPLRRFLSRKFVR